MPIPLAEYQQPIAFPYCRTNPFLWAMESLRLLVGDPLDSQWIHRYTGDATVQRQAPLDRPPFEMYEYVDPCPASPRELTELRALYHWCTEIKTEAARTEAIATIPCPYWQSLAAMACAWYHLKEDSSPQPAQQRLAFALPYLVTMPAKDWQIAALEYVHRWAVRRGIRDIFVTLLAALWGELAPSYRDPGAVRGFILHDLLDG